MRPSNPPTGRGLRDTLPVKDPEPCIDADIPVVQSAFPVVRRADDHYETSFGAAVFSPMRPVTGGPQELLFQWRRLFPRHAASRLPEEDREVRMAAEEELKIRFGKKPRRLLCAARVDGLVERPERIEGEGVGKNQPVEHSRHGNIPEEGQCPFPFRIERPAGIGEHAFHEKVVVPFDGKDSVLFEKTNHGCRPIVVDRIAEIPEMHQCIGPESCQESYRLPRGLKIPMAVGYQAKSTVFNVRHRERSPHHLRGLRDF